MERTINSQTCGRRAGRAHAVLALLLAVLVVAGLTLFIVLDADDGPGAPLETGADRGQPSTPDVGSLPVLENLDSRRLLGVIEQRDVLRALHAQGDQAEESEH